MTYIRHVCVSAARVDSEGAVWLVAALAVNKRYELHCSGCVAVADGQRHCNQQPASCSSPGAMSRMPELIASVVGLVEYDEVDKSTLDSMLVQLLSCC